MKTVGEKTQAQTQTTQYRGKCNQHTEQEEMFPNHVPGMELILVLVQGFRGFQLRFSSVSPGLY